VKTFLSIRENKKGGNQSRLFLFAQSAFQVFIDGIKEFLRIEVVFSMFYFVAVNADSQVFGHFSLLNGFNANIFQGFAKIDQWLVIVEFASES
jgi:hypothetical protein